MILRLTLYVVRFTLKKNTKKKIAGYNGYRSPRRFAPRDDKIVLRFTSYVMRQIQYKNTRTFCVKYNKLQIILVIQFKYYYTGMNKNFMQKSIIQKLKYFKHYWYQFF